MRAALIAAVIAIAGARRAALCGPTADAYHDPMPIPLASTSAALALALQDQPSAQPGGNMLNMLVMFGGPLLIFWFVLLRPERKERKRKAEMLENLKKNDRVLTSGGLYASVAAVHEQEVVLKFDESGTRVRALKSAIASVLEDDGAKDKPQG
jgi:preprotein translocase subunit YajC